MKSFDMRTAMIAVFKYRVRAMVVFFSFIAMAVLLCLVMKTQYQATASVLVKLGRELVYRSDVGSAVGVTPTVDKDQLIESNMAIMKSPIIARQVLDTIGIDKMYPQVLEPVDGLAAWMQRALSFLLPEPETPESHALRLFANKLTIAPIKKTDMIAVSFMHRDPEIAARAANLAVELFQRKSGEIYADPNLPFAETQVEQQRQSLAGAEAALTAYERKHSAYELENQVDLLLKQKIDIDSGLKAADARVAELRSMIAALQAQRATTPSTVKLYSENERYRTLDDSEGQLASLQLQERQFASRYADNYEPLIAVRNQIALAKKNLAAAKNDTGSRSRMGVNDTFQNIDQELLRRQAELSSLSGRRDTLQAQLTTIGAALDNFSGLQKELLALRREVSQRTDALKASYDKLVEARTIAGLNREKPASFILVEAAVPPELSDPARPLPVLYTLIAAAAGLIAAAVTVFVSNQLRIGFLTAEEAAKRLGLPVLAVVDYRRKLGRIDRFAIEANRTQAAVPAGVVPGALWKHPVQ